MRNKILLIEDSKVIQQMYRSKLIVEQLTLLAAYNGIQAVRITSQEIPDLWYEAIHKLH